MSGEIYRSNDGGSSWQQQYDSDAYFRSIGFVDTLRGWVGNVWGDHGDYLYETDDGGITWSRVRNLPRGPRGICGIWVVDRTTVYATGRSGGPAFVLKSVDGGKTWLAVDMKAHADQLVDVYFWTPNEGIVVGSVDAGEGSPGRALVLYTSDGGHTWQRRYAGSRMGERAWKISFPTRTVGYVSIEGWNPGEGYFLKTTDGGATWEERRFWTTPRVAYLAQGIGFVTPTTGWMGSLVASNPTLETNDGGQTWSAAGFGVSVNRFRFLGPDLGFASGATIYKYSAALSAKQK